MTQSCGKNRSTTGIQSENVHDLITSSVIVLPPKMTFFFAPKGLSPSSVTTCRKRCRGTFLCAGTAAAVRPRRVFPFGWTVLSVHFLLKTHLSQKPNRLFNIPPTSLPSTQLNSSQQQLSETEK